MRTDWANFAATGNPSSRALPWPSFDGTRVLSLVPLQSQVDDRLRHRAPLLVLGRRMTHPPSPALHPDSIPSS